MHKYSPWQSVEVEQRIKETIVNQPNLIPLLGHIDSIAKELVSNGKFDYVDGKWRLSDSNWTDWLFSGGAIKYL